MRRTSSDWWTKHKNQKLKGAKLSIFFLVLNKTQNILLNAGNEIEIEMGSFGVFSLFSFIYFTGK